MLEIETSQLVSEEPSGHTTAIGLNGQAFANRKVPRHGMWRADLKPRRSLARPPARTPGEPVAASGR